MKPDNKRAALGGNPELHGRETRRARIVRRLKEHTGCFTCARTYFRRILYRCPRCNSSAVQHYTSEELNLLCHA